MKLSQFKYKLPEERIANEPCWHRDEARMMVVHRKTGDIEHRTFKNILEYFGEDDTFVFNDTQVFPARLYGNKEKSRTWVCSLSMRNRSSAYRSRSA